MFSPVLSQKTITSFFSSNSSNSTDKPKREQEKNDSKVDEDNCSSPIKIKKRKRDRPVISSDDEDSDSNKSEGSSSIKEGASPQKNTLQATKFRDFFNSDEKSVKKIKTYSRSNEALKIKERIDIDEERKNVEESTANDQKSITKSLDDTKTESSNVIFKDVDMSPKRVEKEKKSQPAAQVNNDYNPSRSNYDPVNHAFWMKGEKVPYLALCTTLQCIENISARLKMIEILSNFFRSVIVLSPNDLAVCVYLCLNKLAPDYVGLELGIGDTILMKAISVTTGKSIESLKSELKIKGDLGIIAESCRTNQRTMFAPPKLTTRAVYDKLKEISQLTGHSSTSKKVDKIQSLLVACQKLEARYLIRSLVGKLRIGLAEQSLLAALAQAATLTPPNQQDWPPNILDYSRSVSKEEYSKILQNNTLLLKTTYCECPNYDAILSVLLDDGFDSLAEKCKITPGIPVKPMLAHPTKGVHEILTRFQDSVFTCEFKYDGERAQIHMLEDKSFKIYSRNQEDNTSKYPDVTSRLHNAMNANVTSCILDCEAVAWDKINKEILPFQILSTRKRKDASESQIKIQVCIFAFDLIYINGQSLVKQSFGERRKLLQEHFQEIEGEFAFVSKMDSSDVDEIAGFLDEAIKSKCEGLMVKTLEVNATYEIAKRSHNWLKLKKDYLEGVGDSLDLVVIGGYYGKGKRTGNYGGFLLACYDPETEEFQTITKIGTGFKDEDLAQHSSYFKKHEISKPKSYYQFDSSQEPDVWFDATQVWEVKCADLSISPVYKAAAGVVDSGKGISIRFPRFIRVREDKNPEDATSSSQVVSMYENQENVKKPSNSKEVDDDMY